MTTNNVNRSERLALLGHVNTLGGGLTPTSTARLFTGRPNAFMAGKPLEAYADHPLRGCMHGHTRLAIKTALDSLHDDRLVSYRDGGVYITPKGEKRLAKQEPKAKPTKASKPRKQADAPMQEGTIEALAAQVAALTEALQALQGAQIPAQEDEKPTPKATKGKKGKGAKAAQVDASMQMPDFAAMPVNGDGPNTIRAQCKRLGVPQNMRKEPTVEALEEAWMAAHIPKQAPVQEEPKPKGKGKGKKGRAPKEVCVHGRSVKGSCKECEALFMAPIPKRERKEIEAFVNGEDEPWACMEEARREHREGNTGAVNVYKRAMLARWPRVFTDKTFAALVALDTTPNEA